MGFRWAIWKVEAKLLGLLFVEALISTVLLTLVVAETAGYFAWSYRGSLATFFKVVEAGAAVCFVVALYRNLWSDLDDICDEPLREPLSKHPALEQLIRDVSWDMRRPMPRSGSFLLSPIPWRRFGCDAVLLRQRGDLAIPLSCLAIWPVLSLRCYIGHTLIKRRPKAWLFFAVRRSLKRLSRDTRRKQASKRLSGVYLKLMMSWDLMADMEADLRVAKVLGGSTVATWICQTQLASQIAPTCLQGTIQPGAERGVLLPIAFSCAAFYGLIESGWMATVENARVKAQRSQPGNPLLKLLVLRLAALSHGSGSVQDPRPAATLLSGFESLEERLLRHEAALGTRDLRRASIGDIGRDVVLPQMREEVERNATLLEGRSVADLPDLIREIPKLAVAYHADSRHLLAPGQRAALVPWLLASFLTLELERSGWSVDHTIPPGLIVQRNGRTLCPQQVVKQLRKGEMSREEYLKLVSS